MRVLLTRVVCYVAVVAASLAVVVPPAAATSPQPAFTSGNGITVQSVQQLDPRLYALTVSSGAVDGALHIRVLVPDGYAQHPNRRYPVLYLIHGTSGGAADWTDQGAAEATTAGRQLITVMPDIGINDNGGGYCTNWFNGGQGGKPMWETFEIGQVIPFVDRCCAPAPTAAAGRSPASPKAASARTASPRATPTCSSPLVPSPGRSIPPGTPPPKR